MALNPATDNRGYTGTGSDQTRATAVTNQTGPVATNKQLFSGTLAGNVIASTANPKPLVPYLSDGTILVRGFVTRSANNLTSNGLGELESNVVAQTGRLVDYNAGGGSAFTMADLFAPVYGVDNQTCSKLSTDGTTADFIGMFLGIDALTGQPMVLVDPMICKLLSNINAAGLVHLANAEAITGVKTFTHAGLPKINNSADTFSTQLDSAATANRVFTFPDATDTAVGRTATQTLTNKTLTSPAMTDPTATGLTTLDDLLISATKVVGFGAPQALSGAGAVNVTTLVTNFTSTGGAQALTLANGTRAGQLKVVHHTVDGGSGVLTPASAGNFATFTLTNIHDACLLQWSGSVWNMVLNVGGTIA